MKAYLTGLARRVHADLPLHLAMAGGILFGIGFTSAWYDSYEHSSDNYLKRCEAEAAKMSSGDAPGAPIDLNKSAAPPPAFAAGCGFIRLWVENEDRSYSSLNFTIDGQDIKVSYSSLEFTLVDDDVKARPVNRALGVSHPNNGEFSMTVDQQAGILGEWLLCTRAKEATE